MIPEPVVLIVKNRTILLLTYEFHQKLSQRFNASQPKPRSHVCAVTFPIRRWELYEGLLTATEFEASKYPVKSSFPPSKKLPNAAEYPLFSMLSK